MSLYVYCLGEDFATAALEGVTGVQGAATRVITCGAVDVVISDTGSERVDVTRENVIAHEEVIKRVLARTTPLPCRFGTIVTADDLQKYVDVHIAKLMSLVERVRGTVEMNIKVIWDKEAITGTASAAGASGNTSAESLSPGRAFLLAKQREISGDETLKKSAEEIAFWLKNSLNDLTRETSLSVQPAEAIVIKAAHLVERSNVDMYRERVRLIRNQRTSLRFMTSGPWPPYSFATLQS
jgi:hypothetical protein